MVVYNLYWKTIFTSWLWWSEEFLNSLVRYPSQAGGQTPLGRKYWNESFLGLEVACYQMHQLEEKKWNVKQCRLISELTYTALADSLSCLVCMSYGYHIIWCENYVGELIIFHSKHVVIVAWHLYGEGDLTKFYNSLLCSWDMTVSIGIG